MKSARAFGLGSIGVLEIRRALYYTVILFACLSIFRRTRWWILFLFSTFRILGFEFWINYFLAHNYAADWSDAMLRQHLTGMQLERGPLGRGERWYRIWGHKDTNHRIRETHTDMVDSELEGGIWYGLVDLEGKSFPLDKGESSVADRLKKRRSWGFVEPVAPPLKQYYGPVGGHDDCAVRGSSGQSSVRGCDTGEEGQSGQSGQNGTLDKKKKKRTKKHG